MIKNNTNIQQDIYLNKCKLALKYLKKNNFNVLCVDNKEEALKKALLLIPKDSTVGIGGSVTVREIGLIAALEKQGNTIFTDWAEPIQTKEKIRLRKLALTSDIYLTSSNAITLKGQLVNIDCTGNRVSAMIFGPKKTIIIIGANKIVNNINEAFDRIRNISGPLNSKRLKLKSPCVLTGRCVNCKSPDRICNISVVIEKKPKFSDITIILVAEELGY